VHAEKIKNIGDLEFSILLMSLRYVHDRHREDKMTVNLMSLAAQRILYLANSQNVLARNVANIDTPGYTPQTMAPFRSALGQSMTTTLATTHSNDLPAANGTETQSTDVAVAERAPDGNAVSLTQELAAVAKTQIEQQYSVNIYKSYIGMFTTALGPNV
jgi:flagellar basal-body rod protein FlgB